MKKLKLNRRKELIKCLLLALASQSFSIPPLQGGGEPFWQDNFSLNTKSATDYSSEYYTPNEVDSNDFTIESYYSPPPPSQNTETEEINSSYPANANESSSTEYYTPTEVNSNDFTIESHYSSPPPPQNTETEEINSGYPANATESSSSEYYTPTEVNSNDFTIESYYSPPPPQKAEIIETDENNSSYPSNANENNCEFYTPNEVNSNDFTIESYYSPPPPQKTEVMPSSTAYYQQIQTDSGQAASYSFDHTPSSDESLPYVPANQVEQSLPPLYPAQPTILPSSPAPIKEPQPPTVNIQTPTSSLQAKPINGSLLNSEPAVPNLNQAKGDVRIVKKHSHLEENSNNETSPNIVGKQNIQITSVGFIEPEELFDTSVNEKELIIAVPSSSQPPTPIVAEKVAAPSPIPTKSGSIKTFYKDTDVLSQLLRETSKQPKVEETSTVSSPTINSHFLSDFENDQTIAQALPPPPPPSVPAPAPVVAPLPAPGPGAAPVREISINFNNVSMIEYIRFISRITNKNFIFNEEDLQFNVTIVSEEPTSIDNLMAALLQELKIRDLLLIEQGNNIIIHRNPRVRAPATIVADGLEPGENDLVTRVFRLNTLDPIKASEIIRPLLSDDALVEVLRDSNNLIITDIVANVIKIAQLIENLDAPNSGLTIGQYVVRNAFVDSLVLLAERILQPIAQGNPFVLVPHPATNSIFIVSNPFIVERALAILENLDINEGRTKIFTLDKLRLREAPDGTILPPEGAPGRFPGGMPSGPEIQPQAPGAFVPYELPGVLRGDQIQSIGTTSIFDESREFPLGVLSSVPRRFQDLPAGHIERTLFFIYKLKYRRGDQIEIALRRIADSLMIAGTTNLDLVAAINSIQWIDSTNSLIFTGTALALEKVRELIEEIDLPLRQVFIEMLVLDTTIADSLRYGVEWGVRFGGGNTAGAESFLNVPGGVLSTALNVGTNVTPLPFPIPGPLAAGLAEGEGFSAGVIGRTLTHDGTRFNTLGALVTAVHTDAQARIILNPKIITEDNHTAEIFVGDTSRYKTQSISNDLGNVITNNFQFIDVGTTLRVTPLIGSDDVITLDVIEEITNANPGANVAANTTSANDVNLIPVLSKSRTITKLHVPNGFFVVMSGLIRDTNVRTQNRIPCLGGIPIIGAINKHKANIDDKRNLMIFIRPLIVDSEDELEYLTKRQQDIYLEKTKFRRSWNYEIDEALDHLNIRPTDPDEIGCTIR